MEHSPQEPNFNNEVMKLPVSKQAQSSASTATFNRGPIFMVILVLLVVALGLVMVAMVLWNDAMPRSSLVIEPPRDNSENFPNNEPETTTTEAQIQAASVVSNSNEIPAIDADLRSTDLSNIESELSALDALLSSPTSPTP